MQAARPLNEKKPRRDHAGNFAACRRASPPVHCWRWLRHGHPQRDA